MEKFMNEISQRTAEFFIVALHMILCLRNIYPKELFERVRRFGCFTWYSTSKELCSWTAELHEALQAALAKKILSKLKIVILTSDDSFVEQIAFILLPQEHPMLYDLTAQTDLDTAFRDALTKLHFITPKEFGFKKKFSIHIETVSEPKHGLYNLTLNSNSDRQHAAELSHHWLPCAGSSEGELLEPHVIKTLSLPNGGFTPFMQVVHHTLNNLRAIPTLDAGNSDQCSENDFCDDI